MQGLASSITKKRRGLSRKMKGQPETRTMQLHIRPATMYGSYTIYNCIFDNLRRIE
jgi:hypothetical protein